MCAVISHVIIIIFENSESIAQLIIYYHMKTSMNLIKLYNVMPNYIENRTA